MIRIIKLALLSFAFLFVLITCISFFIPSHIRISKAINLKANKKVVMDQLRDAANWKNWYPGLDSAALLYVAGIPKGVILSNKPRAYIIINKEYENEIIAKFITRKMKPVLNGWKIISYSVTDSITLQWYMDFHLRWYPWEKFGSLMLEKLYGAQMEKGLTNLKKRLENN